MKTLSIIIPCHNEEENVNLFYSETKKAFNKNNKYKLEFIFINDGSYDNTLIELKKLIENNNDIKIINFSRNFGKESAIYAGLKNCSGDYAVLIDADLQQHPKLIIPMLEWIEKDDSIDIVAYYQEKRIENKFVGILKKFFYRIINKLTNLKFVNGASDFRLFNRKVIDSILEFSDQDRFQKGIFAYIGYNTKYLPYTPNKRNAGKTNYNISKLINYAFMGIMSFTKYPVKIPIKIGIIEHIIAIIWFICAIIFKLNYLHFLLVFILLLSSILLICLGLVGEYVYRAYAESRKRPTFIIKEIISNEKISKNL